MNKETNELIKQLANKLGTTTDYLWKVLISQAKLDAITTLIQIIIIGLFAAFLVKTHFRFSKEDKRGITAYEDNDAYGIFMIILSSICGIFVIIGFFLISDVVNGFLNPEYWALSKILDTIKPQ